VGEFEAVLRSLDQLGQLHEKLASIAARKDDRRKSDLIGLRRELSLRIVEVGRVVEPVIINTGDPELLRDYRRNLSRVRSAAAMHQAKWPAVSLDNNPHDYAVSARSVRDENQHFVTWVRSALDKMR
jgi:hypothetical protein